jgi:hypothetical protein
MPNSMRKQKSTAGSSSAAAAAAAASAAAASAESTTEFHLGCRVRVVGLAQAAHHNGKRGVVMAYLDTQTGRIGVELEDGAEVCIKPCNMQLLLHPDDAYPRPAAAAVPDARRTKAHFIEALVAQPAFLFAFQTGLKQLHAVFPSRFRFRFERNSLSAMPIRLGRVNRLLLTAHGRLCTVLVQKMFTAPCHFHVDHLALGTRVLSKRHAFDNPLATCVATLEGHRFDVTSAPCRYYYHGVRSRALQGYVTSVAFHPTAPLLATGSTDRTAKLWRLSSDNSSATCVTTLAGHINEVFSVAFHPTAPVLVTGSGDDTLSGHSHISKLWRLSSGNTSATCVATLEGNSRPDMNVTSVAFHPTAPLLATGSEDKIAKLWRLSSDNSSATCVATLAGHSSSVTSVAFHPTAPVLVTGSRDNTAKLWR